jgi:hypothetical protein
VTTPYATAVLADSPTMYWQLDDGAGTVQVPTVGTTVADSSGHGRLGTWQAATGGFHTEIGQPGLVSGGGSCLKWPSVSYGEYLISDNVGPSNNLTIEVVVRVHSSLNYQIQMVQSDVMQLVWDTNASLSHDPGALFSLTEEVADHSSGGDHQLQVGTTLAAGVRYHLMAKLTGTIGDSVPPGVPTMELWQDNVLLGDFSYAMTSDLNLTDTAAPITIAGYGIFVEHIAFYDYAISSTQAAAHIAAMGDVQGFGLASESDLGHQIGYPRTFILYQAGLSDVFDISTTVPGGLAFGPHHEDAGHLRIVGGPIDATLTLGQAVETDLGEQVVGRGPFETTTPSPDEHRATFPPRRLAAR